MAKSFILDRDAEPQFSRPIRQIITMLLVVALLGLGIWAIYAPVRVVFEANLVLSGFIAAVFVIGVLACFWQVVQLTSAVSWIEGFALDRPGHEFTRAPRLLAPLASLLRGKDARRLLTSSSTRSILDSVATRLDEARDITRYIINLLIFLGLLGTFWGLSLTMPKVVEVIRSLAPQSGDSGVEVFSRLMGGLEGQLEGIGTAFSASLLGLAGSLFVGLLELFASHGQNRFYRELEEWLSSITRIGLSPEGEAGGGDGAMLLGIVDTIGGQIGSLKEAILRSEDRRAETDERLVQLTEAVTALLHRSAERPAPALPDTLPVLERIAQGQEKLTVALASRDDGAGGFDPETRQRLRNIDVQLLRILEEMAAGRQDSIAEIRTEINTLSRTLASAVARVTDQR